MKIMDYKNKYEQALERMKIWISEDTPDEFFDNHEVHTFVFPELKESKDERIRKELLEFLDELSKLGKNTNFDRWSKSDCADWICWLEKQDSQKLANSANTCKDEQKPVDCIDCTNSKGCINCENGNMKETLVQTAWSEEDESYLNTTIAYLKDAKEFKKTADNCINWLKAIRPQNKWNPSDEQSKKNAYIKIYESNNEICGNIGVLLSYKTINKQAREILYLSYEYCQDIFCELHKLYPEIDEVIDPS